jgi:hypothetical protein
MRDSGLDKDRDVKLKRSLYSLRHTYAHFSILNETMDVYTLARQMGTSVKMIELHYGHLQPSQKANVIAGKRMGSKKKTVAAADEKEMAEKPKLERVK